jgi:type VI secretion system protein ImpA
MALSEELLADIPGDKPGGVELRYDPIYDKIKEARREDADMPQGEWQTELKKADWPLVIRLSKEALASKSKDLQIAAWLTEALTRREGLAGLTSGLELITGLLEKRWDDLYPEIEDGDVEMRAAPVAWIGVALGNAVQRVALNDAKHDLVKYEESKKVPSEADAAADSSKAEQRAMAITDGKLTPEEFERSFKSTSKAWYKALVADIEAALQAIERLDQISQERFASIGVNFKDLRDAVAKIQRAAKQLLKRKLELEPDPADAQTAADLSRGDDAPVGVPSGLALPGSVSAQLSVQPSSREDAAARIATAARFIRQASPHDPAPYLLLRGFRWGELRATGASPDPRLLEAPTTQTRTQLKSLLLDGKWEALLEAAENVMGTAQGRGWIDLQRYALTACMELGSDYQVVTNAIRGALRGLLADLPQLVDMTLMDDTPTANAETRAWLRTVLRAEDIPHASDNGASEEQPLPSLDMKPGRDARIQAQNEVKAGRTDRAIQLLMREASREKTRRGRYLLQTQLASIMVDAGHGAVAMPILEELIAAIEVHKLEEWESGDLVAQPMALLYRCLEKADGDATVRHALYLRICKLDPLQAMGFSQPSA